MSEIINFEWCEKHGFEQPGMNVASDSSYCLTKDEKYLNVALKQLQMTLAFFAQQPAYIVPSPMG